MSDRDHSAWCRQHFEKMKDLGVWVLPRSGMVFRKERNRLIWVGNVPADDWRVRCFPKLGRDSEFEGTRLQFGKAGITVEKSCSIVQHSDVGSALNHWKRSEDVVVS
jgi:hypothetical protein